MMLGRLAYAHVIYPLYHAARRDGVNGAIRELRSNQWLTADQIASIQRRKLERLLLHAYGNVPYYRDAIGKIGGNPAKLAPGETFARLPVLTKKIIREQQAELCSTRDDGNRLRPNSTSGSTGEPLRFYTDDRITPYLKASVQRFKEWTGWRLSSREACLWGAPIDAAKASAIRGRVHSWISGSLFLSAYDLNENGMDGYVSSITAYKPELLVSYPSILEVFAEHCRRKGVKLGPLRGIITSAETLWPHQRDRIESAFGVKVFDRYGSREVGDIAQECEEHDGLHVNSDCMVLEIVDPSGNACGAGEVGDILVTSLHNYGMPLIRYAIGDRAAWARGAMCRCGRGLPLLSAVEGRSMDVVRTRAGLHVGGTYWTIVLRSRPGIAQFQVVQETLEGIVVNYVRDGDFDPAVLAYFTDQIKAKCGGDFQVSFREERELMRSAAGKRRLVVSTIQ